MSDKSPSPLPPDPVGEGGWTVSGPYHYEGDIHPSYRIDSADLLIASVYCQDGLGCAAVRAHLLATAPALFAELSTSQCPRPVNTAPDYLTVAECMKRGECACTAGDAIRKAQGQTP